MSFNTRKNQPPKAAPTPPSSPIKVSASASAGFAGFAGSGWVITPLDDFNARAYWAGLHLLGEAGWTVSTRNAGITYWRRPGKFEGHSALVNSSDQLVVFSTSTPFTVGQAYSKYAAYATLHHGGNLVAASAALHRLGYGLTHPPVRTHQGGAGHTYDSKSQLFLSGTTNFFGQKTFYETGNIHADRFVSLCHQVALEDPAWFLDFVAWLRNAANMRSAALVASMEGVRALLANKSELPKVQGTNRGLLRVLAGTGVERADEFGEVMAYWTSRYGKAIPKPIKRALADALVENLTEYTALKYNSDADAFKLADVIRLVHPKPVELWQRDLFGWLVNRDKAKVPASTLGMIRSRNILMNLSVELRRSLILTPHGSQSLKSAGMTWESLAGWLQGPLDKAAWEAIIPSMGYMALLRNLRNFDQAGVSDGTAEGVAWKLANPTEVIKSRQLPMRFLSAYRNVPSLRWSLPLAKALETSLLRVPVLPGRTLVLVDTSGSMNEKMSDKSELKRWDAAAIFGVTLARTSPGVELYSYSSELRQGQTNAWAMRNYVLETKPFSVLKGQETLGMLARWESEGFNIGGGTPTTDAAASLFNGHDRVVIITDGQPDSNQASLDTAIPAATPLYIFDIGSYRSSAVPTGPNVHVLSGLTDHMFSVIGLIEQGKSAEWPWTPSLA